ncbi:hypothetical protein FI667_g1061, partial [Globisporangium splendens]
MDKIKKMYNSGFSRIPVYGKDVNDVLGIIFVKDLVYIDPKENVPLQEFVHVFARAAHRVWADSKLGEVLSVFKQGGIHMALVYDVNNTGPGDPFYELKGMVTLEDVVEEILQTKIVDDTDSLEARHERKSCVDRITLDYEQTASTPMVAESEGEETTHIQGGKRTHAWLFVHFLKEDTVRLQWLTLQRRKFPPSSGNFLFVPRLSISRVEVSSPRKETVETAPNARMSTKKKQRRLLHLKVRVQERVRCAMVMNNRVAAGGGIDS